MLEIAPGPGPWDDDKTWRKRARAALDRCGRSIADAVCPGHDLSEIDLTPLRLGHNSMSFRLENGQSHAFVKVFDSNGAPGQTLFWREKNALLALRKSGLVPRMIGWHDSHRLLILQHEVEIPLTESAPEVLAFDMGRWLAQMDAVAPFEPWQGTWHEYLTQFGGKLAVRRIESAVDALAHIPVAGLSLSRNTELPRFMRCADGRLLGTGFKRAVMRPRGWDFALLSAALPQMFPRYAVATQAALAEGFDQHHRGDLSAATLDDIAAILHCANLLTDTAKAS